MKKQNSTKYTILVDFHNPEMSLFPISVSVLQMELEPHEFTVLETIGAVPIIESPFSLGEGPEHKVLRQFEVPCTNEEIDKLAYWAKVLGLQGHIEADDYEGLAYNFMLNALARIHGCDAVVLAYA